ncbi:hypothetical protein Cgig2_011542 [Carnegiea gigantea]|uniref:Retrotransposon Copia-like N-terminal domain-containing protein n=1 Tax=Carnegiea gigantea TaxID=171969 RepID=A0A9Q1K4H4_9CARY|nr:hypothetical protein Cgig2_011542 [Carnegiea gigantea]
MAADRTPNRNHQIPCSELQNPLFIHPSDGPNSISVPEKLIGAKNYRSWRRSMEINLSTKRKLVLCKWDSCNKLVISWIMNCVCDSISSILYVESACEIWIQLKKRFSLSNGYRKYRLSKDVYSIRQNGGSVSDYYTRIKGIWEELDSMMDLPKVSVVNEEIANFLRAFGRMQEEQKLFQFLKGLDDVYKAHRS